MKRVAHQVLALAHFHNAAPQPSDIVNSRLQRPVVSPSDVGAIPAYSDLRQFAHRRVHRVRKLLLVGLRRQVVAVGGRGADTDGDDAPTEEDSQNGVRRFTEHRGSPGGTQTAPFTYVNSRPPQGAVNVVLSRSSGSCEQKKIPLSPVSNLIVLIGLVIDTVPPVMARRGFDGDSRLWQGKGSFAPPTHRNADRNEDVERNSSRRPVHRPELSLRTRGEPHDDPQARSASVPPFPLPAQAPLQVILENLESRIVLSTLPPGMLPTYIIYHPPSGDSGQTGGSSIPNLGIGPPAGAFGPAAARGRLWRR